MQEKSIAAFFDFDKTLLNTESSRIGIRYLRELGMVSTGYILKAAVAGFLYDRHLLSDDALAGILLKIYRGRRLAEFQGGAADFYDTRLKPHLAPRILKRLNWHHRQGHVSVLVSGSLRYMLEPAAAGLGIGHLLCSDLEEGPDGRLTGRFKGRLCMGDHKRRLVQQLSSEIGLDLSLSFAYGDHHSDLPLLKLVGNPHAVEPDQPLKRVALENDWPILTYS